MIKSIHVQNFQSIEDIDIDLGQFTVVTGPTDSGKSAFMRAIKAMLTNQAGQDYISQWAKETKVELVVDEFDEHHKHLFHDISWRKGETAYYNIDGQEYSRLGREVPTTLTEILPITPIKIGDVEISPNYHDQFDMPFLLSMPAPQRAKVLGELTGANLLLAATQEGQKRQKKAKSLLAVRREDLVEITSKLEGFRWIADTNEKLQNAGDILTQAYQMEGFVSRSTALRDAVLSEFAAILSAHAARNESQFLISEFEDCITSELEDSIHQMGEQVDLLSEAKQLYDTHQKLEGIWQSVPEEIYYSELALEWLLKARQLWLDLDKEQTLIKDGQHKIIRLSNELAQTEIEMAKLIDETNICPVCGQQMDIQTVMEA